MWGTNRGSSSCELPEGLNLYGKLYYHWNKYSDNDTARMDVWLDPLGTGVTSLQGMTQDGKTLGNEYEGPTDLKYKQISTGEIQLTWNAGNFSVKKCKPSKKRLFSVSKLPKQQNTETGRKTIYPQIRN